jgi:hypothetical protein
MRIREEVKDDEIVTFVLGGDVAGLALQVLLSREPLGAEEGTP